MRFLADENFPRAAVVALEAAGHDIVWIRLAAPGMSDSDVLALAVRDDRVLLTFDKDFGELTARRRAPSGYGAILFRTPAPRTGAAVARLVAQIEARDDWANHFAVVEPNRVRVRRRR